ncbi:SsrA-binding protein SmpB [Candidatus Uhrbacteria bacterium]|nr:SsrA-binding protein SmpB [Candidatus Uhrbacteria bacterium]
MPSIAKNKRAFFDYEILEKLEAGIVLTGQEVKSVKNGHISLSGAYVTMRNNEAWLLNAHISAYKKAGPLPGYDPTHSRKLLLKKNELNRLIGISQTKGLTLIPLSVYTARNHVKIDVGVCRGRKKFDKREHIKKRETDRMVRSGQWG